MEFFEVPAAGADNTPQAGREILEKKFLRRATDSRRESDERGPDEHHRGFVTQIGRGDSNLLHRHGRSRGFGFTHRGRG